MKPGTIDVLHVDDEPPTRNLTKTYLERINSSLSVFSEPSAEAALEQLEQRTVDCIVSDYKMPQMNGLEFLEVVRAKRPTIPFILFTCKDPRDFATEVLDAGANDYFQKQVGSGQYPLLANKISTLVEKHNAAQRLTHLEQQKHIADGGVYSKGKINTDEQNEPMSLAVARAVAARENTDPVALSPPLNEAIDPEALDALFPRESEDRWPSAQSLTFSYLGYSITISEDGQIVLDE